MTKGARRRRSLSDRGGFVLVMTLLLLGLASAGAVAIMIEAKAGATGVAGLAEAARLRSVAQAGAARAVYGSMAATDPLKVFAATEARPAAWRFDEMDVALSATAESDRIDLNEGRPELVGEVFARAGLDDALRVELQGAFGNARARGLKLPGVAALARPCLRSSRELRKLEAAFTILTGAAGLAPRSGWDENLDLLASITAVDRGLVDQAIQNGRSPRDDRRLAHLRPYLSDRSSQYRITARVSSAGGSPTERQAAISLSLRRPYAGVITARWVPPVVGRLCD